MTKIVTWESAGNMHVSLEHSEPAQLHHRVIAELVLKYLPREQDATLLDLGCGLR